MLSSPAGRVRQAASRCQTCPGPGSVELVLSQHDKNPFPEVTSHLHLITAGIANAAPLLVDQSVLLGCFLFADEEGGYWRR